LMLADHFEISHFAHMSDVLGKPTHAAFGGMRVERVCRRDVPDYLCARGVVEPLRQKQRGAFLQLDSVQRRLKAGDRNSLVFGL